MFAGFDQMAVDFLWGIRLNNNREWYNEHKQTYLDEIHRPLGELATEVCTYLIEKHGERFGTHVSRIYKDARRNRTGEPYKDSLWFTLQQDSEDWVVSPAYFFGLSPEGYVLGMGYYNAPAFTMKKFRDRLDEHPAEFERIAAALRDQTVFEPYGDEYKKPKGEKNRRTGSVV